MQIRYSALLRFFLMTVFFVSCNSKTKTAQEERPDAISLESISLTDLAGEDVNMSEFKDKTVFINFWATWCKPCLQEMPAIEAAQKQLQSKNVVFLLASSESAEQIKTFEKRRTFEFRYVRVDNLEELDIQALPTTYIFNPKGELVFSEAGFRAWDVPDNIAIITKAAGL